MATLSQVKWETSDGPSSSSAEERGRTKCVIKAFSRYDDRSIDVAARLAVDVIRKKAGPLLCHVFFRHAGLAVARSEITGLLLIRSTNKFPSCQCIQIIYRIEARSHDAYLVRIKFV